MSRSSRPPAALCSRAFFFTDTATTEIYTLSLHDALPISYGSDDSVVAEVRDEFCPWNEGRWRLGPEPARTDQEPELELDVADLASVYLGAFDFHRLAAAERVRELKPGALDRASALFRTTRPPYCPEDF